MVSAIFDISFAMINQYDRCIIIQTKEESNYHPGVYATILISCNPNIIMAETTL